MAHTNGPWHLWCERKYADVSGEIISNLARVRIDSPEGLANARLIAAAPELLEALKDAIQQIRVWNGMGMNEAMAELAWQAYQQSPEIKRLNAAIAKAGA